MALEKIPNFDEVKEWVQDQEYVPKELVYGETSESIVAKSYETESDVPEGSETGSLVFIEDEEQLYVVGSSE